MTLQITIDKFPKICFFFEHAKFDFKWTSDKWPVTLKSKQSAPSTQVILLPTFLA